METRTNLLHRTSMAFALATAVGSLSAACILAPEDPAGEAEARAAEAVIEMCGELGKTCLEDSIDPDALGECREEKQACLDEADGPLAKIGCLRDAKDCLIEVKQQVARAAAECKAQVLECVDEAEDEGDAVDEDDGLDEDDAGKVDEDEVDEEGVDGCSDAIGACAEEAKAEVQACKDEAKTCVQAAIDARDFPAAKTCVGELRACVKEAAAQAKACIADAEELCN